MAEKKIMKYDKKLLEAADDNLGCPNCAFNENCEDNFDGCVANYSKDETYTEACHLKHCELIHWNELSEDEKSNLMDILYKISIHQTIQEPE